MSAGKSNLGVTSEHADGRSSLKDNRLSPLRLCTCLWASPGWSWSRNRGIGSLYPPITFSSPGPVELGGRLSEWLDPTGSEALGTWAEAGAVYMGRWLAGGAKEKAQFKALSSDFKPFPYQPLMVFATGEFLRESTFYWALFGGTKEVLTPDSGDQAYGVDGAQTPDSRVGRIRPVV